MVQVDLSGLGPVTKDVWAVPCGGVFMFLRDGQNWDPHRPYQRIAVEGGDCGDSLIINDIEHGRYKVIKSRELGQFTLVVELEGRYILNQAEQPAGNDRYGRPPVTQARPQLEPGYNGQREPYTSGTEFRAPQGYERYQSGRIRPVDGSSISAKKPNKRTTESTPVEGSKTWRLVEFLIATMELGKWYHSGQLGDECARVFGFKDRNEGLHRLMNPRNYLGITREAGNIRRIMGPNGAAKGSYIEWRISNHDSKAAKAILTHLE